MTLAPLHGGPDALGVPQFDFSTNSNACGPCPHALAAVQAADATRYPDPHYTALKARLAAFHGVAPQRLLLAASASEFIHRISALHQGQGVCLPRHHYGDYAQAANAWSLAAVDAEHAQLLWACEPSSPLGQAHPALATLVHALRPGQDLVLDCAYAPLRLQGSSSLDTTQRDRLWQMWTPNKALGLTGIRAAYVIAPVDAEAAVQRLQTLCPSWPVGAHGVAMLQAWCAAPSQQWLADTLPVLRDWKQRQRTLCLSRGWSCLDSDANFFCAKSPGVDLAALRARGIKLRDATSFGLPGHVRLGVLPPAAQDALTAALSGA